MRLYVSFRQTNLNMDKVLLLLTFLAGAACSENLIKSHLTEVLTNVRASSNSFNSTQYEDLQPVIGDFIKTMTRQIYPMLEDIIFDPEIPTECENAFRKIFQGMQSFHFWAYEFLRSSGGLPSGLDGNSVDLGNYDACLAAQAKDDDGNVIFTGRYCTMFLRVDNVFFEQVIRESMNSYRELWDYLGNSTELINDFMVLMSNRIGVCVPSTCRGADIEYTVKKLGGKYGASSWVPACRTLSEDPPLSTFQIFVLLGMFVLATLTIIGVLAENQLERVRVEKLPKNLTTLYEVLRAFSLKRNLRFVFQSKISPDVQHLSCIHGLRAISAFYILYCHSYFVTDTSALQNPIHIFRWLRNDITIVPIFMGYYVVESFFCIMGIMTHRTLKGALVEKNGGSIAVVAIVSLTRRWIRLTVPAMALIAFYIFYPVLLSGPTKDLTLGFLVENCVNNWWSIPAMIGNFFGLEQCIFHLWYIPADFQTNVILVIPVALFIKLEYRRSGLMLLILLGLLSCMFISINTSLHKLPTVVIFLPHWLRKLPFTVFYIYNSSLSHLMSTVIGILVGHLIDQQRIENPKKFLKPTLIRIWTSVSIIATINFFLPFYWQTGGAYDNIWSALYPSISRVIWCSALGWLIFACATGLGGFINTILSSSAFIPLSRVSFSFYLVHVLVMSAKVFHQRNAIEVRHYLQAVTTLGDFVISFFFSLVLFCLVEAPTTQLEKMLFEKLTRTSHARKKQRHNEQQQTQQSPTKPIDEFLPTENYKL